MDEADVVNIMKHPQTMIVRWKVSQVWRGSSQDGMEHFQGF